jgi:putative two-component system response regulator
MDATDLLTKPVHPEDLIARLRSALRMKDYQDQIKAYNADLEIKVAQRTAALESSRREILWRLAKAGESRDEETGNHVARVGCYGRAIAERLGLPGDFIEAIFLAGPLHDIGKIGIPDGILLKPGRLTPEERLIMEKHCVLGAEILSQEPKGMRPYFAWRGIDLQTISSDHNPVIDMAVNIALCHHEKWDGSGYPRTLQGQEIPMAARIIAIADVFDALCSRRPYKPPYPEETALEIMAQGVGNHFDPMVHQAFIDSLKEIRIIQTEFPDPD